ncbi:MAG: 4-hydroxy-3-methylbut-2-enyl diphosphate reductase [Chloroflexi bacterium]|nr:4-hydroxy-3-methylbut-2-enyl diphosphate reductase [Chloroflexota bacterium]MBT7082385.1 4-hydroxy-3-methylbut-2-enyl diphosphate reductase [Chloroflexota bacterium]MBT7290625.1 4-hydroxy-3-methylbut-2-enyl diphosphate reductase [Chloroflexota bacterium]
MQIKRASEMGFCFGVRRALDLVWKAVAEHGKLQSLGAIVHNQKVVDDLARIGVVVADNLDQISSRAVVITSHGVGPSVTEQMQNKGLQIVDTTCPHVKKAQNIAKKLADDDYAIIIFGEAGHPEVRGLLGWAGGKGKVVADASELPEDLPNRLGIMSQTTQSPGNYADFVRQIAAKLPDIAELRVFSTICEATSNRLDAALDLARVVDLMIVVGGSTSSNTKRLAEASISEGITTYHIQKADEIEDCWFDDRSIVGVTAGASTPDNVIDAVVDKLTDMAGPGKPA